MTSVKGVRTLEEPLWAQKEVRELVGWPVIFFKNMKLYKLVNV